jgi:choline dehydrogenase-like flavoprotein
MSDDRRVVVIGSGPAGAMAAYELVGKGIPVTMLETGEDIQRGTLVRMAGRNLYRHLPGRALCSFADRPLNVACVLVKIGTSFNLLGGKYPLFLNGGGGPPNLERMGTSAKRAP